MFPATLMQSSSHYVERHNPFHKESLSKSQAPFVLRLLCSGSFSRSAISLCVATVTDSSCQMKIEVDLYIQIRETGKMGQVRMDQTTTKKSH